MICTSGFRGEAHGVYANGGEDASGYGFAVFGIFGGAGHAMVVCLYAGSAVSIGLVEYPSSDVKFLPGSRVVGNRLAEGLLGGAPRTLNSPPMMERIMMAKTDTTTLSRFRCQLCSCV